MAVSSSVGGGGPLAWPALVPLGHHTGKPPIQLRGNITVVGSRHTAHVHLLSRQVSKAHALILVADGKGYLRDLASRTHVFVNGQQVREAKLGDGDVIQVGMFTFRYQAGPMPREMRQRPAPPAAVLQVFGGECVELDERVVLIGRRPECDLSLAEESVSMAHAAVLEINGRRFVRDLGSRIGTFVNGKAVRQEELNLGDVLRIGRTEISYVPQPQRGRDLVSIASDSGIPLPLETAPRSPRDEEAGTTGPGLLAGHDEGDLTELEGEAEPPVARGDTVALAALADSPPAKPRITLAEPPAAVDHAPLPPPPPVTPLPEERPAPKAEAQRPADAALSDLDAAAAGNASMEGPVLSDVGKEPATPASLVRGGPGDAPSAARVEAAAEAAESSPPPGEAPAPEEATADAFPEHAKETDMGKSGRSVAAEPPSVAPPVTERRGAEHPAGAVPPRPVLPRRHAAAPAPVAVREVDVFSEFPLPENDEPAAEAVAEDSATAPTVAPEPMTTSVPPGQAIDAPQAHAPAAEAMPEPALPVAGEMRVEGAAQAESAAFPSTAGVAAPSETTMATANAPSAEAAAADDALLRGYERREAPGNGAGGNGERVAGPIADEDEPLARAYERGELSSLTAPAPRVRRGRLLAVLGMMVVCMLVAMGVVWVMYPPSVNVKAVLPFDRFQSLGDGKERVKFQEEQAKLLREDDGVRLRAIQILHSTDKGVGDGFLADPRAYARKDIAWREPADPKGQWAMILLYHGNSPNDEQRVAALLAALCEAGPNAQRSQQAGDLARKLAAAKANAEDLGRQKAALAAEGDVVAPVPAAELKRQMAKLMDGWAAATAARRQVQTELDRMQQANPASANAAGGGGGAVSAEDEKLMAMQRELSQLSGQLNAGKQKLADQTAAARKALDQSMKQFEESVTRAKGALGDNPDLAQYVTAAQKLQSATQRLAGELLQRQQSQQEQLLEYKRRLDEQIEARRRERMAADPELRQLTQQVELKTREHNAAVDSNLTKEAAEVQKELEQLDVQVKARIAKLGEDAVYADAVKGLKDIIDSAKKQLDEDRKRADQVIKDMEDSLAQVAPSVQKLPGEQKALAGQLSQRLKAMTDARQSYADAAAAQDVAASQELKQIESRMKDVQGRIAARQQEVAAENARKLTREQEQKRLAELAQKRQQLESARQAEDGAQKAHEAKALEYYAALRIEEKHNATRPKMQEAQAQHEAAQKSLAELQQQLGRLVTPAPPAQVGSHSEDPRGVYMAGSAIGIALVFAIVIALMPLLGHREELPLPVRAGAARQTADEEMAGAR